MNLELHWQNKIARILYFYEIETKIAITHGFIKKTQKTPRKEIEKAKDLKNQYKTGIK